MVKPVISMDLADGKIINIEVENKPLTEDEEEEGVVKASQPEYLKKRRDFGETIDVIKPVAEKIIKPLRKMKDQPDNIEVQLQFKFNLDSHIILTTSDSEANFKVTLNWSRQNK